MGKLRPLRLVHGHGEHGLDGAQAAGQRETDSGHAIAAQERHPQRQAVPLRHRQRDADVAVHQSQSVVVAGHQHGAAFVPSLVLFDQPARQQGAGDAGIESLDAVVALAQRAQQLELVEGREHRLGPGLPCRVVGGGAGRRPQAPHHVQITRVALRPVPAGRGMAIEQQAVQRLARGGEHVVDVRLVPRRGQLQHAPRRAGVTAVDGAGELADAAVGAEPPRVAQHDGLLGHGMMDRIAGLQAFAVQRGAADRFQPLPGGRRIASRFRVLAQVSQHGAGLDGGQLILVSQQHQARRVRQRIDQIRHHLHVDHGGFVHHQHVDRQGIARVVAEVPGVGAAAQQAVQCRDVGGNGRPYGVRHGQPSHLFADGCGQARRRLAGGRGKQDAQRPALSGRRQLQQGQEAHHGGGLAGARTAGDDADAAAGGKGACELLPIRSARRRTEQPRQALGQARDLERRLPQASPQGSGDPPLEIPVAAQIEPLAIEHQRRAGAGFTGLSDDFDQRAGRQRALPGRQVQAPQHVGRQPHGQRRFPFGRQRQRFVGIP